MSATELLVRAGIPVLVALVGAAVGAVGAGYRPSLTTLAVHFAAGAFLIVALLHLLPESAGEVGWMTAVLAAGAGWIACALLARWAGGFCPACAVDTTGHTHPAQRGHTHCHDEHGGHGHSHSHTHAAPVAAEPPRGIAELGWPILLVVAIHSLLDGLALIGPEGHAQEAAVVSLAVLVHKLPEGLAVAAVCRSSGRSAAQSFAITAAVEAATFAGLAIGVVAGSAQHLLGTALGVVAGSFLYLVVLTLNGSRSTRHPLMNAGSTVAGALLILIAQVMHGPGR